MTDDTTGETKTMLTIINFAADLGFAVSLCWLTWNSLELTGEVIRWQSRK